MQVAMINWLIRGTVLAFITICVMSFAHSSEDFLIPKCYKQTQVYKLQNGLKFIISVRPESALTTVLALIKLGAKHELSERAFGVRYLLARSLIKRTRTRSSEDIERLLAETGSKLNVLVSEDFVVTN